MEDYISYGSTDDRGAMSIIKMVRNGVKYVAFVTLVQQSPFTLTEWSDFLHLSERTMQRYKKEKKTFDPIYSEKIIEISMLNKKGMDVFGDKDKYNAWLGNTNLALGGVKPKEFLDSSFGINLLRDELTRIEHGVLA